MRLKKILAFASLSLLAAGICAQTPEADRNECPANAPYLGAEALKTAGFELPVFKRYCYTDKSGSYALLLGEKQDRPFPPELLSSTLQAALYKVDGGKVLTRQWAIRDFAGKDDGGVSFRSKLVELSDIDGDGLIDPILVYRFFPLVDTDSISTDDFSGGIKIVAFHRGQKATIHAITGDLDGDRKTTANSHYFALPKVLQQHLVKKMAAMYKARQFGFDNSYDFVPRKEAAGR